ELRQSAREQYEVCAKNHVSVNFRHWHLRYLQLQVIQHLPHLKYAWQQKKLAKHMYHQTVADEKEWKNPCQCKLSDLALDEKKHVTWCHDLVQEVRKQLQPLLPVQSWKL